ncbi:MAG: YggS family pyridoxal phosphate-dependent enzyme [Actinomycetales bacterium]
MTQKITPNESELRTRQISERLASIKTQIPKNVQLIVVTKTFPVSDVEILYRLGIRDFGENRDEEGSIKSESIPVDAIWHFQGRIQSKKIKSLVNWSDYIHSLDSKEHAQKISVQAENIGKEQKIFIQINLDSNNRRENRSGIEPSEMSTFAEEILAMKSISIVGLMGVGPLGEDPRPGFKLLQDLSQELQKIIPGASYISAGMSDDFRVAIEFGATHIRLGSSILGSR